MFRHDIRGDQLEVLDCMPDSPGFSLSKVLCGPWVPPVSASFEDTVAGVHRREVEEEPGRGAPPGDLNGTSTFSSSFSFFLNGPNMIAIIFPHFPIVALIWLLGHISSCN